MNELSLLNIKIRPETTTSVLDKLKKAIQKQEEFIHVVSLNPENLVISKTNVEFKKVVETAQIQIVDGVGVQMALRYLYDRKCDRLTGTDLAKIVLEGWGGVSLRIMLIGGKAKIAENIAKCYRQKNHQIEYLGIKGVEDIKKPHIEEENEIFRIVADYKPHIVLVSFGSPDQELWIYRNRAKFAGCLCIGVGGAFDYIAGYVPRAPIIFRNLGMEWLVRLVVQPWRAKRQIRLLKFIYYVVMEKFL